MLQHTKTIHFWVKGLIIVVKHCINWIYFHDDFCGCVEYSDVENQVEIFNTNHTNEAQKEMFEFVFGRRFHDLNYFEGGFFFHIL